MDPDNPPEITPELLQQHPLLAICLTLFSLVLVSAFFGTLLSWFLLGKKYFAGQPVLPIRPFSVRYWGLSDIVITGILMVVTQVLATAIAIPLLGIDIESLRAGEGMSLALTAVVSGAYLITVFLSVAWILLRYRTNAAHLGFRLADAPRMVFVGFVAGLATLPFVFALSAVVSIGVKEYEHPILDAMQNEGSFGGYLFAVFAAVIVAPIAEEFLFRVLLQGWLQSIPFSTIGAAVLGASRSQRADVNQPLFCYPGGAAHALGNAPAASEFSSPSEFTPTAASGHVTSVSNAADSQFNPYGPPALLDTADIASESSGVEVERIPPIWPSIVTGILFGFAHWGYGFSFIPLILLGITLGLLYRATHSIWPCIVVHFMLNASSMAAMGLGVYLDSVAGN